MNEQMTIEVWSDVVCPFCYVGKRKLEAALKATGVDNEVNVVWKSFQLDPSFSPVPGRDIYDSLAKSKGMTRDWAIQASAHVADMASKEGLTYDFDKVIPANTQKAHELIHAAAIRGKQDQMKEALLNAYFVEGVDLNSIDELLRLAGGLNLPIEEIKAELYASQWEDEVKADIAQAGQIGVRGVPFFVFNRRYAISGAQPNELFEQTINQSIDEWKDSLSQSVQMVSQSDEDSGESCGIDGENC